MSQRNILLAAIAGGAVAFLGSATASNAVNLLQNPGFEAPPDTSTNVDTLATDWDFSTLGGGDAARAQFYNHTPGALPTASGGSWSLWNKTFEAAGGGAIQDDPTVAGTSYALSAWFLFEAAYPTIVTTPPAVSYMQLQFLNAGGGAVGAPDELDIAAASLNPANAKIWTQYSMAPVVAPAGSTQVQVAFGWNTGATVTGQQGAFFDDGDLEQVVPEPASLALISMTGLGLLARRRGAARA